jgi:hypothetical protein
LYGKGIHPPTHRIAIAATHFYLPALKPPRQGQPSATSLPLSHHAHFALGSLQDAMRFNSGREESGSQAIRNRPYSADYGIAITEKIKI